MAIGERRTFPVQDAMDSFCSTEVEILQNKLKDIKTDGTHAIDYFCYRRGTFMDLLPLYLGTIAWDNYMIYHCISHKIPVIDLSQTIVAIHQQHDYAYLKGGHDEFYKGTATAHNRTLIGEWTHLFGTHDSSHVLKNGKVMKAQDFEYVDRREDRLREIHPKLFKMLLSWKVRHLVAKYWLWI